MSLGLDDLDVRAALGRDDGLLALGLGLEEAGGALGEGALHAQEGRVVLRQQDLVHREHVQAEAVGFQVGRDPRLQFLRQDVKVSVQLEDVELLVADRAGQMGLHFHHDEGSEVVHQPLRRQ